LTLEEFLSSEYEEGFRYELIQGRLYVVTAPRQRHSWAKLWLFRKLLAYVAAHPEVMNHVVDDCRVHLPDEPDETCPEPDIAGYRDFPLDREPEVEWEEVSPLLVGEVLSPDDPDKDLVRNRDLYLQVPSIKEYWVLDILTDPAEPTLRVHRRWRKQWSITDWPFGSTYTTRLLPGFSLTIDPRQ
jgi:Uma2 family endonuclease